MKTEDFLSTINGIQIKSSRWMPRNAVILVDSNVSPAQIIDLIKREGDLFQLLAVSKRSRRIALALHRRRSQ